MMQRDDEQGLIRAAHPHMGSMTQWQKPTTREPVADKLVVLVIEDDPDIQAIIEDALTDGGFDPAIAPSGEEAVTLLHSGLIKYRVLVTDINLRGTMDGWGGAKRAREIGPEFPVVYITAANGGEWPSQGVPNSILLSKPFAPVQLVRRLPTFSIRELRRSKCVRYPKPAETWLKESSRMAVAFVEARPKGKTADSPVTEYVVEDHADHILATFRTQGDAIYWAKRHGHKPHVARVRHWNDKKKPDHWHEM